MRTIQTGTGSKWLWNWLVFMDFRDWERGETATFNMAIRVSMRDLYQRISSAQSRIMNRTIGEFTLLFLGIIGFLFIIIEFAAFVMGLTLALSITRSIHSLFHGTERVRFGDFAHRIEVRDRDQLGELAESFNAMTANIEDLLQQAQEKRRLEEELRIAREIQMSLLPRGAMRMEGLNVTALCVPAREVGGDYYDFFPLDDKRLGVLIADVAGKGTSAALYMAELKGPDAVAQQDLPLAARSADPGEQHPVAQSRQPQLHHDDLRRHRRRRPHADLRPRRAHAADPAPGLRTAGAASRRCCSRTAWWSACRSRGSRRTSSCCSKR